MTGRQETFDIQDYMTKGVERVVSDAIRATLKNPRESAYMVKFAAASKRASQKRRKAEDAGEHIPPFLIASITSQCNLHCAGCYSRCNTHPVPVLLIMTSNAPDTMYVNLLNGYQRTLSGFVGPTDVLVSGDTLQLKDYSKTDWPWYFDPEAKYRRHETVFPLEMEKAYQMGFSLAGKE